MKLMQNWSRELARLVMFCGPERSNKSMKVPSGSRNTMDSSFFKSLVLYESPISNACAVTPKNSVIMARILVFHTTAASLF